MGQAGAGRELYVVFEVHGHLFALATTHVARLVLAGEVFPEGAPERQVLQADGATWAAWNLGTLLGLHPANAAWILVHVRTVEGTTPIALAVGTCLVVRPLTLAGAVPPGLFVARRGALAAAFQARQVPGAAAMVAGLALDPGRLFTPAEIASSRARLIERLEGRERSRRP